MRKTIVLLGLSLALVADGQVVLAAPSKTKAVQLEEPLAPLNAKHPRSEADEDRIHAAALFATGRMLEKKGDKAGALRKYQRAYRYDPNATSILGEIIPMAFGLGRTRESMRYALLAAEKNPTDPVLLQRLAVDVVKHGDWKRALRLYNLVLEGLDDDSAQSVLVRLEVGRLNFILGNYDEAAAAFRVVTEALDEPEKFGIDADLHERMLKTAALTYQLFGECFIESGKLDEAASAFKKANQAEPNQGLLGYRLARIEAKRNNPVQALEHLQRYFDAKLSSEAAAPYELLIELLGDLNQEETAGEKLAELLAADPDNPALGLFLAGRHRKNKKFDQAEELYQHLRKIKAEQTLVEAYRGLMDIYRQTGNVDRLLSTLAAAVDTVGTLTVFEDEVAALSKQKDLVKKLSEAARVRRADESTNPPAGESLAVAQVAIQAGEFAVADEFYELAVADQPQKLAGLLSTWGSELLLADQYAAAAKVFQRAASDKRLEGSRADFLFYAAGALELDGRTEEALAAAREAAALRPKSLALARRVAWIQFHAKRYDDAIASYRKVIDRFDDQHDSEKDRDLLRQTRIELSNVHVMKKELPQAEEWLEQVLDEFPEDLGALNDLGYLWVDQNKHLNRSLQMVQKAVAGEPDNRAYQDSLGWAYYRLGRYDEALAPLKKAIAADEPDGVILDHLGDVYHKLGQQDQAEANWRRALEMFEKEQDKEKMEQIRKKLKM